MQPRQLRLVSWLQIHSGDQLSFEEGVTTVLKEAGFLVDATGRRLLGVYELIGEQGLPET